MFHCLSTLFTELDTPLSLPILQSIIATNLKSGRTSAIFSAYMTLAAACLRKFRGLLPAAYPIWGQLERMTYQTPSLLLLGACLLLSCWSSAGIPYFGNVLRKRHMSFLPVSVLVNSGNPCADGRRRLCRIFST